MHQLLNIRKTTCIGQANLADFLRITRQGLAKVEKGLIRLNTDNLWQLSRLQACIDNLHVFEDKKQLPMAQKQIQPDIMRIELVSKT